MKPLVLYHDNCADGFGAAFAAWLKLGDEAEYVAMKYNDLNNTPPTLDRDVYILDFSFSREEMDRIFQGAKRVVWLDHHASAFKDHGFTINAPGEPAVTPLTKHDIILDNNRSGALIAWEYFHPDTEAPMLIKHIDDYDRWQFKLKGTKEINKALWSFTPWTFPLWQEIIDVDQYGSMWSQGSAILRAHDQNVKSVVKSAARPCTIRPGWKLDTYDGLIANCPPHLTSDVGHELATKSGTFGLCWTLKKEGLIANCSLRSNGDYDVSAIAATFGGGGHRNAAGFEVPINVLLGWMT